MVTTNNVSQMEILKLLPQDQLSYYCDLNAICRLCMEKNTTNKKMCNIFEGTTEPLTRMIMSCAAVQVLQGDGLPSTICQKCLAKLNIAWQFKLQCESSDSRLRQFYTNPNVLQIVQQSHTFHSQCEKADKLFDFGSNDSLTMLTSSLFSDENSNKDESGKSKSKWDKALSQAKDNKIHQCDTCGKIFNRREYLTQHIRIHTGEKPYCCHICEKRFINSGHLTTHMRTHTGEKPHSCSLCPRAFSTRQELQKHTMVHDGVRPFVCTTCGKRFGSSSNLYSHLRHHTGEKNFTCEHCGKAFYTKQELKQHLVIHTGEKAFLCQYCNKRFSQSAHLRRHLKLHASGDVKKE